MTKIAKQEHRMQTMKPCMHFTEGGSRSDLLDLDHQRLESLAIAFRTIHPMKLKAA